MRSTKSQLGKYLICMNANDVLSLINNQDFAVALGSNASGATDANVVIRRLHTQ